MHLHVTVPVIVLIGVTIHALPVVSVRECIVIIDDVLFEAGYISLIDGHNFISHIRRFYQPVGYIRIYLLRHFVFQR